MDRSRRSLEEYKISDELVNDFLTTLDILKDNNYRTDAKTWTINGFQTDNILNLKTTHELAKNLLKEIKKDLDLFWIHLIEYNQAGAQTAHDHSKTEDYSFILYLLTGIHKNWIPITNITTYFSKLDFLDQDIVILRSDEQL